VQLRSLKTYGGGNSVIKRADTRSEQQRDLTEAWYPIEGIDGIEKIVRRRSDAEGGEGPDGPQMVGGLSSQLVRSWFREWEYLDFRKEDDLGGSRKLDCSAGRHATAPVSGPRQTIGIREYNFFLKNDGELVSGRTAEVMHVS